MLDPCKNDVYKAQDRLRSALKVGRIFSMGEMWRLEPEQYFNTLASANLFANLTCMELLLPPVKMRWRDGEKYSHYESWGMTIALASWGGTRGTVCHELAHHANWVRNKERGHGKLFQEEYFRLLAHTGAPEQARFLKKALDNPTEQA